jgi:hypothetical protein
MEQLWSKRWISSLNYHLIEHGRHNWGKKTSAVAYANGQTTINREQITIDSVLVLYNTR